MPAAWPERKTRKGKMEYPALVDGFRQWPLPMQTIIWGYAFLLGKRKTIDNPIDNEG